MRRHKRTRWLVAVIGTSLDAGRRFVARVENDLQLDAWFPVFQRAEADGGRVRTRIRPLWEGYGFACVPAGRELELRYLKDVSGLLKTESGFSSIPNAVMRTLVAREDALGFVRLSDAPPESRFVAGQKVVETGSPFAFGLWSGMSSDGRHRVLYNLLGRHVEAMVEDRLLQAA